jgi:hypothetical protein
MIKPVNKRLSLDLERAEAIAAEALSFLAADAARLHRFFALTGLDPAAVRARVGDAELLLAVLEYLANDESLLLVFAASSQVAPERIAEALSLLQASRP